MKKIVTRRFDKNLSGYFEPKYIVALKNKNKTTDPKSYRICPKQLSKIFKKNFEIIVRKKSCFLVIYCETISSDKSH